MFLAVYVDDFKLAGPKAHLAQGWDLIRKDAKLLLEPPAAAHLYLGCIHRRENIPLAGGRSAQAVVYDMESYLSSTVSRYSTLVQKLTGKPAKFKHVDTPFIPEDQHNAPTRAPCSKGPSHTCPWCSNTFTSEDEKLFNLSLIHI